MNELKDFYLNKNILITGGTGSLGKELIKQLNKYTENITCLSRDEFKQWYLEKRNIQNLKCKYILGDVRDKNLNFENIDIIFHTAAIKHIDIVENNINYAVDINVNGTINLLQIAKRDSVKYFITISTDKASNPTNAYGATKLLAERTTINANCAKMKCFVVRFGNIFASRGSVAHAFHDMLINNTKLSIYNKDMTRFSVSINDAALHCIESILYSKGGDIIIPKNKSYYIMELAKCFYKVYKNIEINDDNCNSYINKLNLRVSEKIHEDLISEYEFNKIYENDNYYICLTKSINNNYKNFKYIKDFKFFKSNQNKFMDNTELEIIIEEFKKMKKSGLIRW